MIDRFAFFCLIATLGTTGCAIVHERSGSAPDAGPGDGSIPPDGSILVPPDGSILVPPDAFVVRDAWVPPFVVAPHAAPTPIPDQGGPRVRNPALVVVSYVDDPDRAAHEEYARWLVGSTWLAVVGAEYGVGSGSIASNVRLTTRAPSTLSPAEVRGLAARLLDDGTVTLPAGVRVEDTIVVLFFPESTVIQDETGQSCQQFGGYHDETTTADGRTLAFAVLPRCRSFDPAMSDEALQDVAISHEVIEAATDPRPMSSPAWAFSGTGAPPYSPWLFVGGEVADLCEFRQGDAARYTESGHVACRVWSNAAALANDRDPCIPAEPGATYTSVAITPDEVIATTAGARVTFDVVAWSTAPTTPIDIAVIAAPAGDMTMFEPTTTVDRTGLVNGDRATITVDVPFSAASGQFGLVYVYLTIGGSTDVRPLVVYVP